MILTPGGLVSIVDFDQAAFLPAVDLEPIIAEAGKATESFLQTFSLLERFGTPGDLIESFPVEKVRRLTREATRKKMDKVTTRKRKRLQQG
ncbi:unnamed protein product, partial [marine sediment metagenome]